MQDGGKDGDFSRGFIGNDWQIFTDAPQNFDYVSRLQVCIEIDGGMEAFQVVRTAADGTKTQSEVQPSGADLGGLECETIDLSVVACIRQLDIFYSSSRSQVVGIRVIDSLGRFHGAGNGDVTDSDL